MKTNLLIIAAALAIVGIAALMVTSGPEQGEVLESGRVPVCKEEARPKAVIMTDFPSSRQTSSAPVVTPAPNPHEEWLSTLYESPSIAERLAAARQIAARNDEPGMAALATFISAAEENGDPSLLLLAGQVAELLGAMHGLGVEDIATELAYSPSRLVAEAAVDAAVKSQPAQAAQQFTPGAAHAPADQQALDGYVQEILEAELQNMPQVPDMNR
jgi:hypothetical protein